MEICFEKVKLGSGPEKYRLRRGLEPEPPAFLVCHLLESPLLKENGSERDSPSMFYNDTHLLRGPN